MHNLIIKYLSGEITKKEKAELFSLIEHDAVLRKEFINAQNLQAISSFLPSETDTAKAAGKLKELKRIVKMHTLLVALKRVSGYAAVVALTALVTWQLTKTGETQIQETQPIAYEEFITPAGQRAMVKLYDGTIVWLNARSSLRYPHVFVNGERRVELDGEAFFEVAHNAESPFVVSTEKLDIQVLGTEFNVHAYKGRSEFNTSLVEGSLKIYTKNNEGNALLLEPYEMAELVDNKLLKKHFSSMEFLLWKDGIYAFDDIAFTDIIKKLELYYETTIHVENPRLSTYKFTGKFRQRDGVESVLNTLRKVYHFSYIKDEDNNVITIR